MKVLVTGATGFVGREILLRLNEAGHTVCLLSRRTQSAAVTSLAARYGAEIREGNVCDASSLGDAAIGADAVIHLVGIISEIGGSTFENVHTLGTQNILGAAGKAGVRRFIHMSALGTRSGAIARYHKSKWAAEESVRTSGLDWTIFRPSIIYGPGDGFVNLFAQMARYSPVLPLIGGGRSKMQPVAVGGVAKAFVQSLGEPKSIGRTFDLCGGEVLTLEQIIDSILAVTGRRRWKLPLPVAMARIQAAIMEFVYPVILRKAPPLNRDQLLMLNEDNTGNAAPANELFGLAPSPFREGIAEYLK